MPAGQHPVSEQTLNASAVELRDGREIPAWHRALAGWITLGAACLALPGCGGVVVVEKGDSGPPAGSVDTSRVPDAIPRVEPKSRYGNPPSYEVFGKRYYVMDDSRGYIERGIASWYGSKFHGRRTSSGETYDMYAMTAAHRNLPLPTYVEVFNLNNGRKAIVRVNDRGPFHDNRIIDLSYAAADRLGLVAAGTGLVEVRAIDPARWRGGSGHSDPAPVHGAAGGFYIQVGAFSNRSNAERLRSRLGSPAGLSVAITEASVDGRPLFRVRIGPVGEIEVADRIVAGLGRFGITEHRIVTD
jgi:rare lipoprotein A